MADRDALRRQLGLAVVTGALFFVAAVLSDRVTRGPGGLETIWPGNALVLGILIARGRTRRDIWAIAMGGIVSSLIFHVGRGDPPTMIGLFGLANIGESLTAFVLLRYVIRAGPIFDRVSDVIALIGACVAASLVSATVFALGAACGVFRTGIVEGFLQWFGSSVLSELTIAPMAVILAQRSAACDLRAVRLRGVIETHLVLALVAIVTALIFRYTGMPLLFLIGPCVLLATFRLRAVGAVGAVAIVAVIAASATSMGYGPIVAAIEAGAGRVMLLQLFLACCFLTALPVAAMLTERDARADEARQLADSFKAVVENIEEVIFRIDRAGRWAYLNPAWGLLQGHGCGESIGGDWLARVEPDDRAALDARLQAVLSGEAKQARCAARFATATGIRWMEIYVQGLRGHDGEIGGATGTLRDIDDRKRLEDHVMRAKSHAEQRAQEATLLASTDELTGIANRRAFMRQLDREVTGAAEFGWPLAVAIFDVDHFKTVNDLHGHATGDQVLQLIAARAGGAVRSGDLVGRLGGEEFGILMPRATAQDAALVAERVRLAIETPRPEEDDLPCVTVSIGLAARENEREAGLLLAAADTALYAAKGAGRNRVRIAA